MNKISFIAFSTVLLILFLPVKSLFALAPILLHDSQDEYIIGKHLEYLEDENKELKIIDVSSPQFNSKFVLSDEDQPNFGYTSSAYWLRFKLTNNYNESKRWILLDDYPLTDDIQIYIPDLHGNKLVKHGGRFVPHSLKDEDYRCFAFHLDIPANSEYTYYFRVESEDSLPVILSILSDKRFTEKKHTNQIILGFYYGFIFAMIIYYLFIFFSTRDVTHLYYIITLIFLHFLFQFSLNGFSYQYIDHNSLWWARDSIVFFETLGVFFAMLFAKKFLDIKNRAPLINKLYNVTMSVVIVIAILSFFLKYYYMIILAVMMTMVGAALMWAAGLVIYLRGYRAARYYLMAWTAIQFFGCFYGFKTLDLFPSMFISEWGFQIGSLLHSFLMSFALADLINIMRDEKDIALQESMSLKEEMNIKLESEVRERTKELTNANSELVKTRDALWGEMAIAKKIQTVLLPIKPAISGYEISAFMDPADEIGGDYYDIINLGDINWITIGDVSGHGVSAGLIMMMVQTSIRTVLEKYSDLSPSKLLGTVNNVITSNIKKMNEDKYMTITVLACLKDGELHFSGLHQDIMIYRKNENNVQLVKTNGFWIGLLDDVSDMNENYTLKLNIGDTMLLYTDGITEAWEKGSVKDKRDPEKDMFGDEKLADILSEVGDKSCKEIESAILEKLDNYDPDDDITLVTIKRLE